MGDKELNLQWYIDLWNVRLELCKHIEIECPHCKGCASPYYIAYLISSWNSCDVNILVKHLPFPTKVEQLSDSKGYKIYSFPNESDSHSDIYEDNHSGTRDHAQRIISQCSDCHKRVVIGNRVTTKSLYWHVQTRHGVLWAYNRSQLVTLKEYIAGANRARNPSTSRLPPEMLKGSNRGEMIKLIDRVLLNGPVR